MPGDSTVLPMTLSCAAISPASVQASITAAEPRLWISFVSYLFEGNKRRTELELPSAATPMRSIAGAARRDSESWPTPECSDGDRRHGIYSRDGPTRPNCRGEMRHTDCALQ